MSAGRTSAAVGALALASVAFAACARQERAASVAPAPAATSAPSGGAAARPTPDADAASVASRTGPLAAEETRAAVAAAMRGVLGRALADSAFPGAIAVVGDAAGGMVAHAVGRIDWPADAPAPDERTLWDLASLTKVVGTTSVLLTLVGDGRVQLDAPVQRYLPQWTGANKERVTVRHLLSHASGLPSWRPLYKEATSPESARALVLATNLDTLPGVRFVYSDLNFILLGMLAERVTGAPLERLVAERVAAPVGMADTRFRPDAAERARIAPTEYDPWRQRQIRGEVHDENAFALGGVAGHAGLFSTAADLSRLARTLLAGGVSPDGRRVFRAETLAEFTRVQDTTVSRRALGWETPTGGNSAGHYMTARAFGHTGFTGTSLWMDPARGVYVLLLTARVNPTRTNTKIGGVRVALADSALRALGADVTFPPRAAAAPRAP